MALLAYLVDVETPKGLTTNDVLGMYLAATLTKAGLVIHGADKDFFIDLKQRIMYRISAKEQAEQQLTVYTQDQQ